MFQIDWLLIAELCNAVEQMVDHHEWDMTSGEVGKYIQPIYESIMTIGFPQNRSKWDELFERSAVNTWGKEHECDTLTDREVSDFVLSLADSLMDREPNCTFKRPIDYLEKDLGIKC